MWREHPEGEVRTDAIPFVAALAFPQSDGTIWWTGLDGLWSWSPGGAWRRLVASPPVMRLHREPDVIHLEPFGHDSVHAYRWSPGADAVEPVPLGPEGPCWSSSTAHEWTASAYPRSDAVRLQHRDGTEHVLTCASPFNVAWAGRSLVVSTRRGELMLFRDLIATLDMER
jgi:hypothetical protein